MDEVNDFVTTSFSIYPHFNGFFIGDFYKQMVSQFQVKLVFQKSRAQTYYDRLSYKKNAIGLIHPLHLLS